MEDAGDGDVEQEGVSLYMNGQLHLIQLFSGGRRINGQLNVAWQDDWHRLDIDFVDGQRRVRA